MTVKVAWQWPRQHGRRTLSAIFTGGIIFWCTFIGFIECSIAIDILGKSDQVVWGKGRAYVQSLKGASHTLADEMASFKGLAEDVAVAAGDSLAVGPRSFTLIGKNGDELAEVMPGTPLTVVRSSGFKVEVEIRGWSLKAYPVALSVAVGQRIILAKLTKAGVATQQVTGEGEDDYGESWQEVRITGLSDKALLVGDVSTVWELADKFYVMKCGVCHSPQFPIEYPAYQWLGILSYMAEFSNLNKKGLKLVQAYVQHNASDMVDPDILLVAKSAEKIPTESKVPFFKGYEGTPVFSVVGREKKLPLPLLPCSKCHQPDPPKLENLPELMALHPNPVEMYHGNGMMWCTVCHQSKESDFLHTFRGEKVELDKAYLVCGQCHADRQKDWYFGGHGKRVANWRGERILFNCTACHDPHDPGIKPRKPQPPPPVRTGLNRKQKNSYTEARVWESYMNGREAGFHE